MVEVLPPKLRATPIERNFALSSILSPLGDPSFGDNAILRPPVREESPKWDAPTLEIHSIQFWIQLVGLYLTHHIQCVN